MRLASRRGTTLVETIVVLAILGIVATVVSIAFSEPPDAALRAESSDPAISAIHAARREAVRVGVPITVELPTAPRDADSIGARPPRFATVLPDGSVITDRAIAIAPLSGARRAAPPAEGRR